MRSCWRVVIAVLAVCVANAALAGDIESGNVVGYMQGGKIRKGNNTYTLPLRPDKSPLTVEGYLESHAGGKGSGLIAGDRVLVTKGIGNEKWGTVGEDGDALRIVGDDGSDLSQWRFPFLGGDQVLKIKRSEDITTDILLSGEFDCDAPLQVPVYFPSAPLSKIRLDPETAKKMQAVATNEIVTVTNRVNVPFLTSEPKKFLLLLKNGAQLTVMVDLDTRLIVDATTRKPINIAADEIARFAEMADEKSALDQQASKSDMKEVVRDVGRKVHDYDQWKAIREGIIGTAWDSDHPWRSVFWWFIVTGVLALANKIWDGFFWSVKWLWNRVRGKSVRPMRKSRARKKRNSLPASHSAKGKSR